MMSENLMKKTPMPEQDPKIRKNNFNEVTLGYTIDLAKKEAKRCLQCKHKPCVDGCPVHVPIPEFISYVEKGDFIKAYEIIATANTLPGVCGRVCPQEIQCESKCIRGIKGESVAIGRLERFVADYYMENVENKNNKTKEEKRIKPNKCKIAIIGSGPAGLSCAGDLAKKGYDVTIYEAFHTAGGVLMYGIPEFRLPKSIVQQEIKQLKDAGVKIKTNMVIGKVLSLDELFNKGFKAIFIGSGAGLPKFMGLPGEAFIGVYSANEFLTRINLLKAYDDKYDTLILKPTNVAVIGGGNVAMDAARSALRLGAKSVNILYRRSFDEMPARKEEIQHAKEEGINFNILTNPVKIIGDENNKVSEIECVKMELGQPDSSGRRSPIEIKNSNYKMKVDSVIIAIGNSPNPLITSTTDGLDVNNRGGIIINEDTMETSKKNVYAGGDAVTGAATVILAMGAGRRGAKAIDKALTKESK